MLAIILARAVVISNFLYVNVVYAQVVTRPVLSSMPTTTSLNIWMWNLWIELFFLFLKVCVKLEFQFWLAFLIRLSLQVQDNSPGSAAGLEAFFDFIVAIGNTRLVSFLLLDPNMWKFCTNTFLCYNAGYW